MSNPENAIEGATKPSDNMSIEELIAQRTQHRSEPESTEVEAEVKPDEEEPEPEVETPEEGETEEVEAETDPEEEEEEDGQEIDLLSLTTEQIQELAKKGKSRLLQRIGELTAQKHALEEKLNAAKPDAKPLQPAIPAESNPFRDLKTLDEVQAKFVELEKVAEETDRILEDHEDYAADDVITVGDKEFTKKEIRLANRNARNAMLKFLPAQSAEIQKGEQLKVMEENFNAAIPKEIPEIADEGSTVHKAYQSMLADPLVEQVRQRVPDLAPQLSYLLAHAASSIISKQTPKKVAVKATGIPSGKVPSVPFGAGAAPSGNKSARKSGDEAYQQFEKTGSTDAWIAARIAKNSR